MIARAFYNLLVPAYLVPDVTNPSPDSNESSDINYISFTDEAYLQPGDVYSLSVSLFTMLLTHS